MIKIFVFDLDGTLIQTEALKAKSYADAIHNLSEGTIPAQEVMERFKKYVGLSRSEVVTGLVSDFKTELGQYASKSDVQDIQDWVLTERLSRYDDIKNDEDTLAQHFCTYNLNLLQKLYEDDFVLALATMSNREEADHVLDLMKIKDKFNFTITSDEVEKGKPEPEIYIKVREHFQVDPKECLVIEDSANGIKAAKQAEMHVMAVTNDITEMSVVNSGLLDDQHIIKDLKELQDHVYSFIRE